MTGKTKGPEPRTVSAAEDQGEINVVKDNLDAGGIKSCVVPKFVAWVRWCKYCDSSFLDTYGPFGDMCSDCAAWQWDELYDGNQDGRGHGQ